MIIIERVTMIYIIFHIWVGQKPISKRGAVNGYKGQMGWGLS